jgi:hypothetical protein
MGSGASLIQKKSGGVIVEIAESARRCGIFLVTGGGCGIMARFTE